MTPRLFALGLALACAGAAQADPVPLAQGRGIAWSFAQPHGAAVMRLADERGEVFEFALGSTLQWSMEGLGLPDGVYRYELHVAPPRAARRGADGQEGEASAQGAIEAGGFTLVDGRILPPAEEAVGKSRKRDAYAKDQLLADDLIVEGRLCSGFDCVDGVDFQDHTLRLAENNLRINFEDTSPAAPDSDWEITANESPSGGASMFAILQRNTTRQVVRLMGGAPADSLAVSTGGDLGVRTAQPQQRFHATGPEAPTLRLDQSNLGGYTAWIWELFGDETVFGVRDVTAGTLPFTIAAGAPTGALTLAPDVRVGVGTPMPEASLHVMRSDGSAQLRVEEANAAADPRTLFAIENHGAPAIALTGAGGGWNLAAGADFAIASTLPAAGNLQLANGGNLTISGTLSQGSSRALKHAIEAVAPAALLERVSALPVYAWEYRADTGVKHLGPMAEDVHAAFGLGIGERSLAPGDVAGLAMAAAQALRTELAERDAELEALLARLDALEARAGGAP